MRRVVTLIALVSFVWLAPTPSSAQPSMRPSGTVYTPLVRGWEQYFPLTWEPLERHGTRYVGGYISNSSGFPARRVQLLVDGLDSSGRVVSQTVSWLGGDLTPGMRAYFEVRAPQPGETYRVSVFAFDWVQSASIQAP